MNYQSESPFSNNGHNWHHWDDEPENQNLPRSGQRPDSFELQLTNLHVHNTFPRGTISSSLLKQLPSRDIGYSTLRRRNIAPAINSEEEVLRIVQYLQNDTENLDLEDVEKLNEEKLRELHFSLTVKRDVKKKLDHNQKRKQKKLSQWKQMKYSWSMKWQHFNSSIQDILLNLQLWQSSLRVIQGKFGSGTAAYFHYLRWLFGLNILFFSIIMIFVVMPQLFTELPSAKLQINSFCDNKTYTKDNSSAFSDNLYINITVVPFNGKELITGGNSFEASYLYYGAYTSKVLSMDGNVHYNIPLAYLLTIGLAMVFLLIITAIVLAKSFKQNYIEHSGVGGAFFANKIFCGWDFAITSKEAAALHSRSLLFDLKEHLESFSAKPTTKTLNEKCTFFTKTMLFNAFALAILGAIGYLMYFLLEKNSLQTDIHFLQEMSLALTVAAISIVVPAIFTIIARFESYSSHHAQLTMSMIRALFLIAVIMSMLLYFWLSPNNQNINLPKFDCWENRLGMEIYRLMIVDFLVWVALHFILVFLKKILHKNQINFLGNLEFNVPWHTWNLLYNQALCWIGTYFSPLIPFVFIIKLFITFYMKKLTVLYFCQPPSRVWRANRAETVFLGVTFFALILSMTSIGYTVIEHDSSSACGPFKMLRKPYDIILCIMDTFSKDKQWLGLVAVFITKPGCVSFFILFLCCLAYYARAVSKARYEMVKLLRKQLVTEGKDKVFLLQMFETAKNLTNRQNQPIGENFQQQFEIGEPQYSHQERGSPSNYPYEYENRPSSYNAHPHSSSLYSETKQGIKNEYPFNSRLSDSYNEDAHSSHESIGPLTKVKAGPKKGVENIVFSGDSPVRAKPSPLANSIYSHQSPFQNLRIN